jgi:hypothetical protein
MAEFRIIAPVHTNQIVAKVGWPHEATFSRALDEETRRLEVWFAQNFSGIWPGLRLIYIDVWALDQPGFDISDFRFLKKSGELRMNARIDAKKTAQLPPTKQALAVAIVLLQALRIACSRYDIRNDGIDDLQQRLAVDLGVANVSDAGLPFGATPLALSEAAEEKRKRKKDMG